MITEKQIEQFRKENKIPDWEVWSFSESMDDGTIFPEFDERETLRNFMKLVIEKLENRAK